MNLPRVSGWTINGTWLACIHMAGKTGSVDDDVYISYPDNDGNIHLRSGKRNSDFIWEINQTVRGDSMVGNAILTLAILDSEKRKELSDVRMKISDLCEEINGEHGHY